MLGLAVVVAPGGSPRTSVNGRYGIPESRFILHIERGVAECGELFGVVLGEGFFPVQSGLCEEANQSALSRYGQVRDVL
jgi:hypothetical protein